MDALLRGLRRALWVGCGLWLPLVAHAAVTGTLRQQITGFAPVPGGGGYVRTESIYSPSAGARVWRDAVGGAGVVAEDAVIVSAKGGPLAVQVAQTVSIPDAVATVAGFVASPGVGLALGGAALLYDLYRAKHPSQVPGSTTPAGQLDVDPGRPPEPAQQWGIPAAANICAVDVYASTPEAVGSMLANCKAAYWRSHGYPSCSYVYGVVMRGPTVADINYAVPGGDANYSRNQCAGYSADTIGVKMDAPVCPASIDPLDPRYSIPKGAAPDAHGMCPTARYYHQAESVASIAARAAANPPPASKTPQVRDALKEAVDTGGASAPASISTTGPASQTGSPTSSTTTTGTSTGASTTTTTTTTNTYNYTYAGDTITYNTTVVTTTTDSSTGATTTTSTSTASGSPKPADATDPCEGNPTRLGCMDAGKAGDQPTLYTKKTKTFGDVLAGFKTSMSASPLGSALGGFFTLTLSSPACPTWALDVPYIGATATIDFFCWPMTTAALGAFSAVLQIVAGFTAWRIAIL